MTDKHSLRQPTDEVLLDKQQTPLKTVIDPKGEWDTTIETKSQTTAGQSLRNSGAGQDREERQRRRSDGHFGDQTKHVHSGRKQQVHGQKRKTTRHGGGGGEGELVTDEVVTWRRRFHAAEAPLRLQTTTTTMAAAAELRTSAVISDDDDDIW